MLYHSDTNTLLLNTPDPLSVRELLPNSRVIGRPDYNLAVNLTIESTRVLRNIGIKAPSPMSVGYSWPGKYKPFAHQIEMADFMVMHRKAFNLGEMGTGKSAASLWAADYLIQTGRVRKVLILSPLSTLERVWRSDIFDVLMHRSAVVVHGTKAKRMAALEADVDFYIMNHDGLVIKDVNEALRRNPEIDLIIVDEASMFRNASTQKYKALKKLIRPDQRLWLLTGTPCPNAPTDAWALASLIAPERVPKYYGAFRLQTMMQVSQFKWVPRTDSYRIAYDAMQPAVRFKKADCLDLPPVVTLERQATLSKEQQAMVKEMQTTMQADADTTTLTAVNAADKINKIRQILCGSVKDGATGEYIEIPHGPRLNVLVEAIEQASAKVLVVVPFKGITRALEAELSKTYSVGVLNGDVSPRMRDKIILDFKTTPDPHILLCHPKVMAHGLNLTEADTLIFYAPIYSNDEMQQVNERFNRAGQTRKMTIVRIAAHPAEWSIYNLVDNRAITQDSILSLYQSFLK